MSSEALKAAFGNLPPEFSATLTEYMTRLASASSAIGIGEVPVDVLLESNHLRECTLAGAGYPFDIERALGEVMQTPFVTDALRTKNGTSAARKAILDEISKLTPAEKLTRARQLGLTGSDSSERINMTAEEISKIKDPARKMTLARAAGLK